jgi:protein-disulfide isomerase
MNHKLAVPFNTYTDHYQGNPDAPIQLVQYGDFQCMHCGDVYTIIKCLQKCLGNHLLFVFRHYPLPAKHPLSLEAAIAVEAAALQGKFWQMHNAVFEQQLFLVRSSFCWLAEELELDMTAFYDCRKRTRLMTKPLADFEDGIKSGVDGTPTFFINGQKYTGAADFESLYQACCYAIQAKRITCTL